MTETAIEAPRSRGRGLLGFNLLTAIVLGVGGFFFGAWIGGKMAVGHDYLIGTDQNDVGIFMGFLFGTIGWLAGLGFFNYPLARLAGRPPLDWSSEDEMYVVPDATIRDLRELLEILLPARGEKVPRSGG